MPGAWQSSRLTSSSEECDGQQKSANVLGVSGAASIRVADRGCCGWHSGSRSPNRGGERTADGYQARCRCSAVHHTWMTLDLAPSGCPGEDRKDVR